MLSDNGNDPGCNVDKCKTKKQLQQKFPAPTAGQKTRKPIYCIS